MGVGDGKRVTIVGAGLGGSLMACYLARMGYTVGVYERRPDPRKAGSLAGRSINLALSARGIRGLAGVGGGVLEKVLADAIPMRGRMVHPPSASPRLAFQPYSKNPDDAINSVSRSGLNLTLLDAAAASPGVRLYFDMRCLDVDLEAPAVLFQNEAEGPMKGATARVESDLVIGADGAFSAVRGKMQKTDRFDYSQAYLEAGYKELRIPPVGPTRGPVGTTPGRGETTRGTGGTTGGPPAGSPESDGKPGFALDPNALHIWPRGGSMMIALPNRDGSFTCTLFWPFEGRLGFDAVRTPEQIVRHFNAHYPDAVPLMPTLVEDYLANPTSSLVTVRCSPWQHAGRVVLLGDAAHAIVPFFGQGMNAAFEDCAELAAAIGRHAGDLGKALPEYQALRKENADAIAELAAANFVEMRDKVASRAFRAKKKMEHALHALLPGAFTPLYNMVSFSTIPYAEAKRRAERQGRMVRTALVWAGALALALVLGLAVGALLRR